MYVCINILIGNQRAVILVYNLLKDKEFTSVNCSEES